MTTSRSDIKNSANWGFETKQVHIGQENPDPATGARLSRSMHPRRLYLKTAGMRQTDLP